MTYKYLRVRVKIVRICNTVDEINLSGFESMRCSIVGLEWSKNSKLIDLSDQAKTGLGLIRCFVEKYLIFTIEILG